MIFTHHHSVCIGSFWSEMIFTRTLWWSLPTTKTCEFVAFKLSHVYQTQSPFKHTVYYNLVQELRFSHTQHYITHGLYWREQKSKFSYYLSQHPTTVKLPANLTSHIDSKECISVTLNVNHIELEVIHRCIYCNSSIFIIHTIHIHIYAYSRELITGVLLHLTCSLALTFSVETATLLNLSTTSEARNERPRPLFCLWCLTSCLLCASLSSTTGLLTIFCVTVCVCGCVWVCAYVYD